MQKKNVHKSKSLEPTNQMLPKNNVIFSDSRSSNGQSALESKEENT